MNRPLFSFLGRRPQEVFSPPPPAWCLPVPPPFPSLYLASRSLRLSTHIFHAGPVPPPIRLWFFFFQFGSLFFDYFFLARNPSGLSGPRHVRRVFPPFPVLSSFMETSLSAVTPRPTCNPPLGGFPPPSFDPIHVFFFPFFPVANGTRPFF